MNGKKTLSLLLIATFILSSMAIPGKGVWTPPTSPPPIWMWASDYDVTNQADLTGTRFNVTVNLYNVTWLAAIEFKLWYNTTLLDAVRTFLTPMSENYLKGYGPLDPINMTYHNKSPIFDAQGMVYWYAIVKVMTSPFSGDAAVLTIEFEIDVAPPLGYTPPNPPTLSVGCPLKLNETVVGWINPTTLYEGEYVLNTDYSLDDGLYNYTRPQLVPGKPVAKFTWTPPIAYVCDTVTCTDRSTPNGGVITSWSWSISGPGTITSGWTDPVMTFHCDGVGSVYVTLTVMDSEGMSDSVTNEIKQVEPVGCMLDIWTSDNRFCGQSTTFLGEGLAVVDGQIQPASAYADALTPDVNITLFASVTWNGAPRMHVLVSFEIIYEWKLVDQALGFPDGYAVLNETIAYRTAETDKDGIAVTWFRVPMWCEGLPFGKWLIIASGKVQERKQEDWIRFDVGYLIQLEGVETVDHVYHEPEDTFLVYCDTIGINVVYKNIALMPKWVCFVAVVYDDCDVPIGQVDWWQEAQPGEYCSPNYGSIYFEVHVPQWAYVGVGKVYVSAFTALPRDCGVAYCPEASTTIMLEWRGPP